MDFGHSFLCGKSAADKVTRKHSPCSPAPGTTRNSYGFPLSQTRVNKSNHSFYLVKPRRCEVLHWFVQILKSYAFNILGLESPFFFASESNQCAHAL
jgi:hypothetical protein